MRQFCSFFLAAILDSPTTLAPFSKSATRLTSALVTGSTRPVTASTSFMRVTASSNEPEMPLSAARNRLPNDWPLLMPSGKR